MGPGETEALVNHLLYLLYLRQENICPYLDESVKDYNTTHHQKEGVICSNMDKCEGHYFKWNKHNTEKQTVYDSTYMQILTQSTSQKLAG